MYWVTQSRADCIVMTCGLHRPAPAAGRGETHCVSTQSRRLDEVCITTWSAHVTLRCCTVPNPVADTDAVCTALCRTGRSALRRYLVQSIPMQCARHCARLGRTRQVRHCPAPAAGRGAGLDGVAECVINISPTKPRAISEIPFSTRWTNAIPAKHQEQACSWRTSESRSTFSKVS